MSHQDVIKFTRVNLETGNNDHILCSVNDIEITILINPDYVTGMNESLVIESFTCIRPVSKHALRSTQKHFTLSARNNLFPRQLPAVFDINKLDFGIRKGNTDGTPFFLLPFSRLLFTRHAKL